MMNIIIINESLLFVFPVIYESRSDVHNTVRESYVTFVGAERRSSRERERERERVHYFRQMYWAKRFTKYPPGSVRHQGVLWFRVRFPAVTLTPLLSHLTVIDVLGLQDAKQNLVAVETVASAMSALSDVYLASTLRLPPKLGGVLLGLYGKQDNRKYLEVAVMGKINKGRYPCGSSQSRSSQSRSPQSRSPQSRSPQSRSPQSRSPQSRSPQSRSPQSRSPQSRSPHTKQVHTHTHKAGPHKAGPHTQSKSPQSRSPHTKQVPTHKAGLHTQSRSPQSRSTHKADPHKAGPHKAGPHTKQVPTEQVHTLHSN